MFPLSLNTISLTFARDSTLSLSPNSQIMPCPRAPGRGAGFSFQHKRKTRSKAEHAVAPVQAESALIMMLLWNLFLLPFSLNPVIINLNCALESAGEFLKNHWSPFLSCFCCSFVAKSCPTLCDPVDCSPPGSSVHGILQARILGWVAISFSRGSSRPRDRTRVSCLAVCVCVCVCVCV